MSGRLGRVCWSVYGKGGMAAEKQKNAGPALRLSLLVILGSGLLGAGIYSAQTFERFLVRDPRFEVSGPRDYGEESPDLRVEGIHYASRAKIDQIFGGDFGRSLYLLPIAERRDALKKVSWVRDATVRRIWPNRVYVRIAEREPAAFIPVAYGEVSRYALIDAEGVILDPPAKAQFNLPVLQGIQKADTQEMRGQRVRRMQRMMHEIGALGNGISEVDVSDLDNLKVRLMMNGQSFLLILGDSEFAGRLQNFTAHFQEIREHVPWATRFDLRLKSRVTAIGETPGVQQ